MIKLLMKRDWLRIKHNGGADTDIAAGEMEMDLSQDSLPESLSASLIGLPDNAERVPLRIAFGTLIRHLREKKRLSISGLAMLAKVDEEELRSIEHTPHIQPKPRTIVQLATIFELPTDKLKQLSGLTKVVEREVLTEARKYAAKSDDLAKLNDAERDLLDAFVHFLSSSARK